MMNRQTLRSVCGAVGLVVSVTAPSAALTANQLEYLTFRAPVALPGVTLRPGTYVFEIANPDSGGDVVRVRSKATNEPAFMGFTRRVERPSGLGAASHVMLGEAPRGEPSRILAWYPEGDAGGREFIYLK